MSIENYEALLRQIARQVGIAEQNLIEYQSFDFKGRRLRLFYLERLNICRVSLQLDPVPGDSAEAMRGMLEANGHLEDELLTVMAFEPESGCPLIQFHLPLDGQMQEAMGCFLAWGLEAFLADWKSLWQAQQQEDAVYADMLA